MTLTSPARMVAISPCMKAHGTLEPTRGQRSPLGQYTSPPPLPLVPPCCCLMLWREHGKQNLCDGADGHCTKCVSSSRSRHSVQHNAGVWDPGGAGAPPPTPVTPGVGGAPGVSAAATEESAGLLVGAEDGDRGLPLFRRDPPLAAPGPPPTTMVVECTRLPSLAGEPALSAAMMSAAIGDWVPCWAVAPSGGVVREWCEGETTEAVVEEEEEEGAVAAGLGAAMWKPGFITSKGDGSQGSPAALPFSLEAEASASGSGDVLRFRARDCCCFPLSVGRENNREEGQRKLNHDTGNRK